MHSNLTNQFMLFRMLSASNIGRISFDRLGLYWKRDDGTMYKIGKVCIQIILDVVAAKFCGELLPCLLFKNAFKSLARSFWLIPPKMDTATRLFLIFFKILTLKRFSNKIIGDSWYMNNLNEIISPFLSHVQVMRRNFIYPKWRSRVSLYASRRS